jgi:hypothetical protein
VSPTNPDPAFIEAMNGLIHDAQARSFASFDAGLQQEMIDRLNATGPDLGARKRQAVADGDEPMANLVLGYECVFTCLAHELYMWIELKTGDADRAWDGLIMAQDAAIGAARAHPGFAHLSHHLARLEAFEELLFPAQVFVSSGFVVGRQVCTICEQDYDECDHVATRPYWGRFCSVRQEQLSLDHVALVDDPASKQCRITHVGQGQTRRNRMSGLPDVSEDETFQALLTPPTRPSTPRLESAE